MCLPEFHENEFFFLAKVFPLGRILQRKLCIEAIYRNPKVRNIQLPGTVFVVGLPRTGSTWFHNLCELDAACRTLKSWELKRPIPCSIDCGPSRRERQQFEKKSMGTLYKLFPRLRSIHYVEFDSPDECVLGFMDCFMIEHHAWGMAHCPNTYNWYTTNSMLEQYQNYAKVVKTILCEDKKPSYDKLVLKSPHHILKLEEISVAFPNAVAIWLHRNVEDVVASTCCMNQAVLDAMCPTYFDSKELGARTCARLANATRLGMAARNALENRGKMKFIDIYYSDLTRDPVGTIRTAYLQAGLTFSGDFASAIEASLGTRRAKRNHTYNLEEFGLSPGTINKEFQEYKARFDI